MVWHLTANDLLQLKGSGGAPFADFADRLIRGEAARGGLAQSEIATQLRVNIPDGGVDTEVKKPIPHDKSGWFAVPTCWQFKGDEGKKIAPKEINKPYAKELIQKGYGYRLCVFGDLTPKKLANWEAKLTVEALKINPNAPEPRVVHGGHLRAWAENFLGIVATLKKLPNGLFHWDAWAANRQAVTPMYVANPDWSGVSKTILQHAQFDQACVGGEACLPIGGAAGVGKTRLVFETLSELPQRRSLVVVAEDEEKANEIATWLATTPGQFAILVADECPASARYRLDEMLRGFRDRIRVICISNTSEPLVLAGSRVVLAPSKALDHAQAVLAANNTKWALPSDRLWQYARLSEGFIRLAADMCSHDMEIMTGNLASVEGYVRRRLGSDIEFVAAISLFHKIGFRDDVANELDLLCLISGRDKRDFIQAVRKVKESPGFVVQAGRFWYVTPQIVGQILFAEAWVRWVEHDPETFFKLVPEGLQQQILERVATLGTMEVRAQVAAFFRTWFNRLTAAHLAQPRTASFLATVVETAPSEYLPLLASVIRSAKPGELKQIEAYNPDGNWGPRRTLVWLLERLASFREFFADCQECLYRLALEETESQIGGNATEIWTSFFSVFFSGTATPFLERLPILEERTVTLNAAELQLGFAALGQALHNEPVARGLGEPIVAGKLRPADWRPTRGEVRACHRAALEICGRRLNGGNPEHQKLAFMALAANGGFLLDVGLFDDLRRTVDPKTLSKDDSRKWLQVVEDFLERQQYRKDGSANGDAAKYLQNVGEWSNLFRPTDFSGKLREICARELWDRRFDQKAARDEGEAELAAQIVRDPELLAPELDWLGSPEAQSAERLGLALGRVDACAKCGTLIFDHAIEKKTSPLLRGYVRGMDFVDRKPGPDLLALADKLETANPATAFDIFVVAGDRFDGFVRILRLVDSGVVSPTYLVLLARGIGRRELTRDEVGNILSRFVAAIAKGEADAIFAGTRFLHLRVLMEHSKRAKESVLAAPANQGLAWQLVEESLRSRTKPDRFEWLEIVKTLAKFDAIRAIRALVSSLLSEPVGFRDQAIGALTDLAASNPDGVMELVGSALLDKEIGWPLQIVDLRGPITNIPSRIVLAWIEKHGTAAARAIARHLPRPHLDASGDPVVPELLDAVFRRFDDNEVLANFFAGGHSFEMWWGNGADQFRGAAETARKFLHHPNKGIREWAKREMAHCLHLAQSEDQRHEERLLPV